MSSSSECACGHPLSAHGDRAFPPACEGAWTHPPLYDQAHDVIEYPKKSPVPACECLGYRRG